MSVEQRSEAKRQLRAISWLPDAPLIILAIGLGAIQAWNHRFDFASEDIVSYLDIADDYLHRQWSSVVNGMWSPLYSCSLALAQAIVRWPPSWDASRVKLVNFFTFLVALAGFRFLLYQLLLFRERRATPADASNIARLPAWLVTTGGYLVFLWSSLRWIGLFCDTPDMSTAALVYIACGLILQIQTRGESWIRLAILGVVLGLGYLSKAALFPLAFVFVAAITSLRGGIGKAFGRLSLVLVVFAITAGPYVTALSLEKGRFTYGDAGKLSYAFWVEGLGGLSDHHWQGGPPRFGAPLHPTRQLFRDPALYEFAEPIGGTYPPWTDVSYWFEGIRIPFTPAKAWYVIKRNLAYYWMNFLAVLLGGFFLLASVGRRPRQSVLALVQHWRILLPGAAGLGVYLVPTDFAANDMPLQPSMRYIAPFVVVLFAVGFSALRFNASVFARRLVVGLAFIGLLGVAGRLGWQMAPRVEVFLREEQRNVHWQIAQTLRRQGIRPGDRVAVIGAEYEHEFWARLARVKIIAQIPDSVAFAAKDAAVRGAILRLIEGTSASAVVWRQPNGGYFAHTFDKAMSSRCGRCRKLTNMRLFGPYPGLTAADP